MIPVHIPQPRINAIIFVGGAPHGLPGTPVTMCRRLDKVFDIEEMARTAAEADGPVAMWLGQPLPTEALTALAATADRQWVILQPVADA